MKYIAETAALVAALSATGAQAAPSQNNKLFNNPSFGILPYTGNPAYYTDPKDFVGRTGPAKRDASPAFFAEPQIGTAAERAWWREQWAKQASGNSKREAFIDNMPKVIPDTRPIDVRLREYKKLYPNLFPSEEKREALVDNMPKVIPHPGGIRAAIEEARRLYPEIYQRDARGFGLEDFLGLPDTSVNPSFGNTGTSGKRSALDQRGISKKREASQSALDQLENLDLNEWARMSQTHRQPTVQYGSQSGSRWPYSKREAEAIAHAFFDNQPKVVYDKNFKDFVYKNRSPFQLQQRAAEAEPFLGDIMKLVGMVIDKTTKRDAAADPFLADIVKLIGMGIDKATKRDAVADPFFADIVKLGGMIIDKTTKRDAVADPFLGDIMKLVGMVIDKTT